MVFQLFHLLGIDTDPGRPDPGKLCGSDPIQFRIHKTDLQTIFSRATVPVAGDKPDDWTPHPQCKHISGLDNFKNVNQNPRAMWAFLCGRRPSIFGVWKAAYFLRGPHL
jgi:hypothetical protein